MCEPRDKIGGGSRALYGMVRRISHWYHRTLFTFVNDLHDKVSDGASAEPIAETLFGLVNYANVHFVREENFLEEAGYEELEDHAEAHRRLSVSVSSLKEQFNVSLENFNKAAFLEFLKGGSPGIPSMPTWTKCRR